MLISPVLIAIVVFVGILVGGVGIGGVLLVPSLKYLGDITLHDAIPACMLSYIATGTIGAFIFSRHGTINWNLAASVCMGAIPGAYIGAFLLPYFSAQIIEIGIALLLIYSGTDVFFKKQSAIKKSEIKAGKALLLIGFIAAIGSSLTGTGGPLLLIPILIWQGVSVLTAIGLSQVIQVPISLMATVGNFAYGNVDVKLGLTLAVFLGIGAIIGAKTVHSLPVDKLKKGVAILLILTGFLLIYRLLS